MNSYSCKFLKKNYAFYAHAKNTNIIYNIYVAIYIIL